MKVLYITAENIYGTGSSNIRNVSMIESIASLGHEVSLLSFAVNENAKKYDENIKEKLAPYNKFFLKNHSLQKVFAIKKDNKKSSISKIKGFIYQMAKKIYLRFSSTDTLSQAVARIDTNDFPKFQYDLVISSSDPISSHILAKRFFENVHQKDCKWIQYWGDPLLLDITRTNKNKKKMRKIEGEILRMADKVVYTNPLVVNEQKKIYPDSAEKMGFIPTPFTFYENQTNSSIEYDIGYFGSYMSCVRDIIPLCKAVISSGKKMVVMGGGDQEIPLNENIESWSFQSTAVVTQYESKCAVLVCLCNASKNGEKIFQIPGKIYHYAVTNKPILVIGADDATKNYLSRYNRFVFCENDAAQIEKAICALVRSDFVAQPDAISAFSPYEIAKEFIS